MGMTLKSGSFLHRRSFLQDGAAVGAGLLGLDLLAACGSPTTTSGMVTPSKAPQRGGAVPGGNPPRCGALLASFQRDKTDESGR